VLHADGIKAHPQLRAPATKLAVVFGDNASGKSLMLTVMSAFLGPMEESGEEKFSVSMHSRTSSGMGRVFMYLDEDYNSTGASSLHAVTGAIYNAKKRKHPVWLMFDEPDTGLSDKFASAMGAYFAQEVNNLPKNIRGATIVTHSRPLLRRLLADLNEPPHEIAMGPEQSLAEYLDPTTIQEASIDELLALSDQAGKTMKNVMSILHPQNR
jgi:energy-coupling factor transporter ATP-binding protein EcfA2